jgi:hypothetical protein
METTETDVVKEHDRFIRALAQTFRFDVEDLAQIGRIALLRSWRLWREKPEHTAQFWTYARPRVLGDMIDFASKELARRSKEIPLVAEDKGGPPSPEEIVSARERLATLPPLLVEAAAGNSHQELSIRTGTPKSTIQYQLSAVKRNLRETA